MEEKILVEGRFNKNSIFWMNFLPSFGIIAVIAFVAALILQSSMSLLFIVAGLGSSIGGAYSATKNNVFYLSDKRFYYQKAKVVKEAALEEVVAYTIKNGSVEVQTNIEKFTVKHLENISEFTAAWKSMNTEKQQKEPASLTNQTANYSNADELKKFKELLDSGVISQEEFDAKKKQLLGL